MSNLRHSPACPSCFACAICWRPVCTTWETALCACNDTPTCDDCCHTHHGTAA